MENGGRMTKTLTEQWREGTLESGWYYTKHDDGKIYIWLCFKDDCSYIENPEVKKILAPVPSYTELTLMAGNYRLAKKALRDCYNEMKYWAKMNHRCSKIFNHIKAALSEIEEVK